MEKLITFDNLRQFCYCNDRICKRPIRGLVLFFPGMNTAKMYDGENENGERFAERGILYVIPYQNPWAWQTEQNMAFAEEILDVLFRTYDLPDNLPIVSAGQSMGGLGALAYMVYAKRTPVACAAFCPVCDLPYHYTERPDLPRTLYSAFYHYDGSLEEALRSVSPCHLVEQMPEEADYYVFHGERDVTVSRARHSEQFVEAMREKHRITYHIVPGMGHTDWTDEMFERYNAYIVESIEKSYEKRFAE